MITRNDDQTNLSPDCIAFLYRFWCILENLPRPSRTFSEFLQLRRGVSKVLYFLSGGRTSDHLPSCEGCPNVDAINGAWAFLKDSARLSVMAVGELCSVMVDELLCYCQGYCKLPKKIPGWCVRVTDGWGCKGTNEKGYKLGKVQKSTSEKGRTRESTKVLQVKWFPQSSAVHNFGTNAAPLRWYLRLT